MKEEAEAEAKAEAKAEDRELMKRLKNVGSLNHNLPLSLLGLRLGIHYLSLSLSLSLSLDLSLRPVYLDSTDLISLSISSITP